jgi:cytochrome c oxidase assembly factor CtaG
LSWNWDPAVLLGILLLCAGYAAIIIGPWRVRIGLDEPPTRRQMFAFAAGMATLALVLITPLDALGRTALFTAHMLQLMVLCTAVAPLLMLGLPEPLVHRGLRRIGLLGRLGEMGQQGEGRTLVLWAVAIVVFNAAFLLWHVAAFYEPGLRDEAVHDLESLTILVVGALRWWPVLTPAERKTRLASPGQILYILLESLPIDIFAIALIFAPGPLYTIYAHAPRLWGIGAMLDQQLAGCVAMIPGTFLDIILMSAVFFAWFRRMEHDQAAAEAQAAMEQG